MEPSTQTETAEAAVSEATTPGHPPAVPSAIVLRADQDEFDHKQLSTLALISPGLEAAPRGHLAMFFHYCVRTGLDPFARQIYMIGRQDRRATRNADQPTMSWTIQTGIDGFRTIAHRAAERTGERISYEDTVYYDPEGKAHEVWLAPGPPAAVKVTVLRGASKFPLIARWDEFAPTYWDAQRERYVAVKMWRTMPAHMLRKCAEAGALRMAAPQDLSGVYADEEMAQADGEVVAGLAEDATHRLRSAAGLETEGKDSPGAQQEGEHADDGPQSHPQQETGLAQQTEPESGPRKAPPKRRRAPRKESAPAATEISATR